MTHLRKIMLEELQRRNYAQTTIIVTFAPSNTSPGTSTVPPNSWVRNTSASTKPRCLRSGSWHRIR